MTLSHNESSSTFLMKMSLISMKMNIRFDTETKSNSCHSFSRASEAVNSFNSNVKKGCDQLPSKVNSRRNFQIRNDNNWDKRFSCEI